MMPVVLYGTGACPSNDVCITLTPANLLSFLPPGLSTNALNVANAINGANTGTPPLAFQNLFNLTPQQLGSALAQLTGEVSTGAQESGLQLMNSFITLLSPSGLGGGGGGGAAMPFAPERETFSPELALAYAKAMPVKAAPAVPMYNSWAAGYGGTTSIAGDPTVVGSHDLRDRAGGVAAGIDVRIDPATVAGFALGGAGTSWSLSGGFGSGRSDAFQAGVYGSRQWGPAYLSGVLSFANYWASTDRYVTVAGTDHLTSSFDAFGIGGRAEGGYHVVTVPFGVTPYAAIQAQYFHTPAFSETAASGSPQFALSFPEHNQTVTRTELGSWFDQTQLMSDGARLKLFARGAWAHDFNNTAALTTTFLGLPAAGFVVNGAQPPANLALATVGGEYRWPNRVSFAARFDGEFGSGLQTYTGMATVKYEW
jgi:outer membrane autotransporter protein